MQLLQTLRTYLLTGAYLNHLKQLIDKESALRAVLQRMLRGGTAKRAELAEERLYWLGIIREQESWALGLDSACTQRVEPTVGRRACVVGLVLGISG